MAIIGKNTVVRKIGPSKNFKLVYNSDTGELDLYKWKGTPILGYWRLISSWGRVSSVYTPKIALNNVFKAVFDAADAVRVIVLDESYKGYATYTDVVDTPWIYRTISQGYLVLPKEKTYPPDFTHIPYISILHYGADGAVDTQTEMQVDSERILGSTLFNLPCPNGHATLALTIDPSTGHRYWSLAEEIHIQLKQDGVTGEWHREVMTLPPTHVTLNVLDWKPLS